jgi:hypothetical protein
MNLQRKKNHTKKELILDGVFVAFASDCFLHRGSASRGRYLKGRAPMLVKVQKIRHLINRGGYPGWYPLTDYPPTYVAATERKRKRYPASSVRVEPSNT